MISKTKSEEGWLFIFNLNGMRNRIEEGREGIDVHIEKGRLNFIFLYKHSHHDHKMSINDCTYINKGI